MVLSIIALYVRIYLRNLTFQETLVFSFFLLVVELFELHQFVISMGYTVIFYDMSKKFYACLEEM